jgi:chromosome segregation ATPase
MKMENKKPGEQSINLPTLNRELEKHQKQFDELSKQLQRIKDAVKSLEASEKEKENKFSKYEKEHKQEYLPKKDEYQKYGEMKRKSIDEAVKKEKERLDNKIKTIASAINSLKEEVTLLGNLKEDREAAQNKAKKELQQKATALEKIMSLSDNIRNNFNQLESIRKLIEEAESKNKYSVMYFEMNDAVGFKALLDKTIGLLIDPDEYKEKMQKAMDDKHTAAEDYKDKKEEYEKIKSKYSEKKEELEQAMNKRKENILKSFEEPEDENIGDKEIVKMHKAK